jgi:hypothetical protein
MGIRISGLRPRHARRPTGSPGPSDPARTGQETRPTSVTSRLAMPKRALQPLTRVILPAPETADAARDSLVEVHQGELPPHQIYPNRFGPQ